MSWSSGAEAAGETGSAAGSASGGSLGSMGSTGGIYGQMADVGGTAGGGASGAGGFSSALDTAGAQGPSLSGQYADTGSSGGGSMMDRAMGGLEQFQKGGQQSLPEAWKGRGWDNPATYGYVAGKLQSMGGGAPQAPNMTTNISYQQPQNDYLIKQRRRF